MNKIYIGADLLMTKESEQNNNIEWLFDFIKIPLKNVLEENIRVLRTDKDIDFDREKFFGKSNIKFNKYLLHNFFNVNDITKESKEYLKSVLSKSLFIGYEISDQTKEILNSIEVQFIDVWLHPIRFLDDVLFGFYSNNTEINNKLKEFNENQEKYYLYAQRLKVQSYKGISKSKESLEIDSAVFAGQTLVDKAIYSNGKMLTVLDFKEKFEKLIEEYKVVYYIPHPFVKSGDEEIINYLNEFKNVKILKGKDSIYNVLSSNNIKKVVTISSSVALEAKYFGKEIEYYFKPIIDINEKYSSVYQSFLYGYFWSEILSDITKTKKVKKIEFNDSKDKIRDSLSFYWSYRDIDKVEMLKKTVGNLFKKKSTESIESKINGASLVSFDVFDTLISRKYYSPTEVFTYMEKHVSLISKGKIDSFRKVRIKSQSEVMKEARLNGKQDISLEMIYYYIEKKYDLTKKEKETIKNLEIKFELDCVQKKRKGYDLYSYCLDNNIRMILTSDMYLPREVIFNLLKKSDYNIKDFDKLYLSSELGKRKTEGDLYEYILADLNLEPLNIVHIGDNLKGDIEMSEKKGLNSIYTPKTNINFLNSGKPNESIDSFFRKNLNNSSTLVIQDIAERFYQDKSIESSLFDGKEYKLGYKGLGPLVIGFVYWLYENAKRDGIKTLYFLSRDGKIFKDAFDIIKQDEIKTKYIYSSRQVVKVSSINSIEKIEDIVYAPIYSTRLDKWLKIKFDLDIDDINFKVLKEKEIDIFDNIGNKTDRDLLFDVLEKHKEKIYNKNQKNLDDYKQYLIREEVNKNNVAVVDIGYAGSMQTYFDRLFNNNISGYYLATFDTYIRKAGNRNAKGYLTDFVNSDDKSYTICTDRFLYESLICSSEDSFIKMEGDTFIFNKNFSDLKRKEKVVEIHKGIIDFMYSMTLTIDSLNIDFQLRPKVASHIFDSFIKYPQKNDVIIMQGILFEDNNGPDIERYIIPPENIKIDTSRIIWEKGYNVYKNKSNIKIDNNLNSKINNNRIESYLVNKLLSNKKIKEFNKNRESFYKKIKSPQGKLFKLLFYKNKKFD